MTKHLEKGKDNQALPQDLREAEVSAKELLTPRQIIQKRHCIQEIKQAKNNFVAKVAFTVITFFDLKTVWY
jgi:hypothetical protein